MNQFFVYVTSDISKRVLYTGFTNTLVRRLQEHYDGRGNPDHFATKYYCYYLLYFETYQFARDGILREKQIKGWSRKKKLDWIKRVNPRLEFIQPPHDL